MPFIRARHAPTIGANILGVIPSIEPPICFAIFISTIIAIAIICFVIHVFGHPSFGVIFILNFNRRILVNLISFFFSGFIFKFGTEQVICIRYLDFFIAAFFIDHGLFAFNAFF